MPEPSRAALTPQIETPVITPEVASFISWLMRVASPTGAAADREVVAKSGEIQTSPHEQAETALPRLEPRLLTIGDLVAMTGLSRRKIHYEIAAGALPHLKLGRATRFRTEDVEAYLEARRMKGRTR